MITDTGNGKYVCPHCKVKYDKREQLRAHFRNHRTCRNVARYHLDKNGLHHA